MSALYELIEVEPGRRLQVSVSGPVDAPCVIFDHGAFGMIADGWWIRQRLSANWRVMLYSRAGMGWSDPQPADARMTPDWHVKDLRRLTRLLDLQPPFVLVGHSMAGLRLHAYASAHPDDIAGLVYVDAMHPKEACSPGGRKLMGLFGGLLRAGRLAARLGLTNALVAFEKDNIDLPPELKPHKRRAFVSEPHWHAALREIAELDYDALIANSAAPIAKPVVVFSLDKNGGEHARTARDAKAAGLYSELRAMPEQSHTSFLNPAGAQRIAAAVARMSLQF